MGDKMAARTTMQKAGLPIVPGSKEAIRNKEEAIRLAKNIGYPVIIKAAAGGGGKGMRICHNDLTLISSLMTAQSEAEANFGNSNVYIEKYIEKPRHIEIQVLADKFGHFLHLGERDCSIQRRHQKLLEESPSPVVDEKLRRRLGEAALKGIKASGYVSAGTIEFLLDNKSNFYFMEMNTRIQVEHPVTEMVTGFDIVREQLRIAANCPLSVRQEDIKITGHAIETRINAEDPAESFKPDPGTIKVFEPPSFDSVRVDTHIRPGYTIPPFYDSLICKLIGHGRDRAAAIATTVKALQAFRIEGVKTTIPIHLDILSTPEFRRGDYNTRFVEEHLARLGSAPPPSAGPGSERNKEKRRNG
jgi:acetyl-CoA carboxylase biotin carboxylase subunit